MNRRGFLGGALGAVTAGPGVAKAALSEAPSVNQYDSFNTSLSNAINKYNPASEVMKIIEGGAGPARGTSENILFPDIAALKSVSPGHKIRMMNEEVHKDRVRYEIEYWLREKGLSPNLVPIETALEMIRKAAKV